MGRPRTHTDPLSMNTSRLLKSTGGIGSHGNNVALLALQMEPTTVPQVVEEDLESQARATLSLFGFGSTSDCVNWSAITVPVAGTSDPSGSSGATAAMSTATATAGLSSGSTSTTTNPNVTLSERVCPIGKNAFLWNVLQDQRNASIAEAILTGSSSTPTLDSALKLDPYAGDVRMVGGLEGDAPVSSSYLAHSQLLQQYLVKCTAHLAASLEEVVELIVRSDKEDSMDLAMQHLIGVKPIGSGIIYQPRRKQHPSQTSQSTQSLLLAQQNRASVIPPLQNGSRRRRRRLHTADSIATNLGSESSGSETSADEMEENENHGQNYTNLMHLSSLQRPSSITPSRKSSRSSTRSSRSRVLSSDRATQRSTSLTLSPYLDEYHASLMAPTGGYNQGNLSVKWAVGDRGNRVFSSRVNYCLVDYECILLNDWDGDAGGPMYVRSLQSSYLPQCQPWVDEFGSKPTDLQPTGIMVRESKLREGYVEVQFVATLLEKAHVPFSSRRAKLRALCYRISKLEEIITSRRLSQSLLMHQPLWVRNGERSVCHSCEAKFHLSRRRHHCRLCGEICCSECCPKMEVALPDVGTTSVRVCVLCVKKRRHSAESIASSSSSSTIMSAPQPSPVPNPAKSTRMGSTPSSMPHHHPLLSSSSSSEYLSSSYSSVSSTNNGIGREGPLNVLGDRKASSLSSTMLQRFKTNSLGL